MFIRCVPKDSEQKADIINSASIQWIHPQGVCRTVVTLTRGYKSRYVTWVIIPRAYKTVLANLNADRWQDEERTWMDVDLVYETRWDCMTMPEGVRLAA